MRNFNHGYFFIYFNFFSACFVNLVLPVSWCFISCKNELIFLFLSNYLSSVAKYQKIFMEYKRRVLFNE